MKINTLLCNGHGRRRGQGHRHGNGRFSFVSDSFKIVFGCFGYIETPKQAGSLLKRNNRNKLLVSNSAEISFGSSFGYVGTKLVS
jgi:hypothetical protein